MAFSFTATAQPATTPPSVLLSVTRNSGTAATIHMDRLDDDGLTREVRNLSGGDIDISSGSAVVTDYEYRYGTTVTYRVREEPTTSQDFAMDADAVWLTHIGVPTRSVTLFVAEFGELTRPVERGVFAVLGRAEPIIVTGNRRSAPAGLIHARTKTHEERLALAAVLDDGSPLLLNVPVSLDWGLESAYVSFGDVTESRTIDWAGHPWREWSLPYQVVARPVGGTRAGVTWSDGAGLYATWSSVPGGKTWAQAAAGT